MSPTTEPVELSVVIVAWNAKHHLELCLESLAKAPPRRRMEVLVVDNSSADDTVEMVESKFPQVRLIKSKENLGFAKGNNVAIRQCQGRYIALVNPDVIVFPGCLDTLADFLDENRKVGNVGPRVFNPDMTQQATCRHFPTLWNNFCSAIRLERIFKGRRFFAGEQMFYFPHDRTMAVDVLAGCFWMVRREVFLEIGQLDESFFMYGEDLDWCRRCWDGDWQVAFTPAAQAIHYGGGCSSGNATRLAVAQQRSVLHYWTKHHTFLGVLGIRSIMLLHHLLRYVFAALSNVARSPKARQDARRRVSGACLRQLLFGTVPPKPEQQAAI